MQLKVSIVVPTYARTALLKKCVEALLHQNFDANEYEIIVVTDGPDATTQTLVQQLKKGKQIPCLQCISLEEKKGPAAARNAGWKSASGTLIAFTDDDCVPSKEWINAFWNAYNLQGKDEIVFKGKIRVPRTRVPTDADRNTINLEEADFVTANCACTKAALQKVGGFDEAFTMAWREDSDLEFKLIKHQIPIVFIREALILHPLRKAPWGVSLKDQKKNMFNALLYKKYPELYREKIAPHPTWSYYAIVLLAIIFCTAFVLENKSVALFASGLWMLLLAAFIHKRLSGTAKSASHVFEMIITSILIPFVSVFWTLYGAYRYKVLFL